MDFLSVMLIVCIMCIGLLNCLSWGGGVKGGGLADHLKLVWTSNFSYLVQCTQSSKLKVDKRRG